MKSFNKKRLVVSLSLSFLVIALIIFISTDIFTYSRYETHVTSHNSITTAVYLLKDEYQTINVKLPDVIPGNNQYKYSFSVSNYNDDAHADTNLKYRIYIRTTTNIDITYELYNTLDVDNATPLTLTRNLAQDADGTYFNHLYTGYNTMLYSDDDTDYYTILFTFPNDFKNSIYSGIPELIEVNVESSQILASDA